MQEFERWFNRASQVCIPLFTLGGLLLISLKYPGWGLVSNLLAQPFWLYTTYRTWKKDGQIGMFLNTCAFVVITAFGVVNYFFL